MFIKVNEVELFYEKSGQGPSVLLLHGNGEDHRIFDVLVKKLSQNYTVYAIDIRDHGKSSKVKNLNYHDMMEDMAGFIRELEIHKPILFGFSDGGIVGMLLAIHYPEMLSKLIISGSNTSPDGGKKMIVAIGKIVYFFTRNRKLKLMLTQPNITEEELSKITTPTVVLAGSNDFVRDEHTRATAKNIPNSVLNILEGENHSSYVFNNDKLYKIIKPYLEGIS